MKLPLQPVQLLPLELGPELQRLSFELLLPPFALLLLLWHVPVRGNTVECIDQ